MQQWVRVRDLPNYEISTEGSVRSIVSGTVLKTYLSGRKGYEYRSVELYDGHSKKRKLLLHRLVWSSFCGEVPEDMHIDHKDNDKFNNSLENLQCVSIKQNQVKKIIDNLGPSWYDMFGINV